MKAAESDIEPRPSKEALYAYNLSGNISAQLVQSDYYNTVYKLEDKQHSNVYAVHLLRACDEDRLLNETTVCARLLDSDLGVAGLLTTESGALYYNDGDRFVTVAPWINGTHPVPGAISPVLYELLGKSLATFHTKIKILPYANEKKLMDEDVAKWGHNHTPMLRDETAAYVWSVAKTLDSSVLPRGIVHGDFHSGNILVAGSQISALDMERVGEGFLSFDIARAAVDLCTSGDAFDTAANDHFLLGYMDIRQLTKSEISQYRATVAYASLCVAAWFLDRDRNAEANHFLRIGQSAVDLLLTGLGVSAASTYDGDAL
jgi:Ser/Thr protein kinase RdoA (MazF antagonist)